MKKKVMWLMVSCLMVAALVLASCAPAAPPEEEAAPVEKEEAIVTPEEEVVTEEEEVVTEEEEVVLVVEIRGSPEFTRQTEKALSLLQNKAPDAFLKVQYFIGIIEQGEHSGMWAYEDPPRYEVSDMTAFYSVTWYAGTIAHDATHSQLYHEYLIQHGNPVPQDVWGGTKVELFCILYQINVMKSIDAPQFEIDYLISLDGKYYDIDGDGDLDWDDYYGRDW